MAKIALIGGDYSARSLIASAQRCVNLYPEKNPEDSPFPFTYYPTPGLIAKLTLITGKPVRCLYTASTGDLYAVCGPTVFYIDGSWTAHVLGSIADGPNPVSMADDRLIVFIVDGTANGYYIDLTKNRAFGSIVADAFYGADKVDYLDTFFVLNRPGTNQFYISASELSSGLINGGAVAAGTIAGGLSYTNGVHTSVPLSGGAGSGCIANVTVTLNAVTGVSIIAGGGIYQVGDVLSAAPLALGGAILTQSVIGGTGYGGSGTYTNVPLTGGSGTMAAATITVAANVVTSVTVTNRGQDYRAGDVLSASSANIGGAGSGFQVLVLTIAQGGSGFTYTVTSVQTGTGAFDALDLAAKSGASDDLVSFAVVHREIWLIGSKTTEVWNNTGAADFTFGEIPGVFIQHGCAAKYSVAQTDLSVFWLGQEPQGARIVFMGTPYKAVKISTYALESEFLAYSTVSDAIGFAYQIQGHARYVLTFPSVDKTWVYDLDSGAEAPRWHEWSWGDMNGIEHRARANVAAYAYGVNVVGDWQNGQIYALDLNANTDAGAPIVRRRGFPHIVNGGKRLCYDSFIAEMDVGESLGTGDTLTTIALVMDTGADALTISPGADAMIVYSSADTPGPVCSLRWSFTKGKSWGNPVEIPLGAEGEFLRSMIVRQLGMGRDCVFELFWSGDFKTALMGAYIEVTPVET